MALFWFSRLPQYRDAPLLAENRLTMLAERVKSAHDIALVTPLRLTLYKALDRSDRAVEVSREYDQIWSFVGNRVKV